VTARRATPDLAVERQFRLARIWSNDELRAIAPLFSGAIVNASAGTDEDKEGSRYREYFPGASSYETTNYRPGAFRGYTGTEGEHLLDLCDDVPEVLAGRFDVVFNHTVLEHVFDVQKAFSSVCALSRDIVIVVVPFAQVQHETPGYEDFWRFTPTCIRRLFELNGLTVVYESASPFPDSAVYLFAVATRHPDRWQGRMPQHGPLSSVGDWIGKGVPGAQGASWLRRLASRLGKLWR
jgi:hypothetical protein